MAELEKTKEKIGKLIKKGEFLNEIEFGTICCKCKNPTEKETVRFKISGDNWELLNRTTMFEEKVVIPFICIDCEVSTAVDVESLVAMAKERLYR